MSYHKAIIAKHAHGSALKLIEESQEYIDALASGNKIMASVELADLYGEVIKQAQSLGLGDQDLKVMANTTKNAFDEKDRVALTIGQMIVEQAKFAKFIDPTTVLAEVDSAITYIVASKRTAIGRFLLDSKLIEVVKGSITFGEHVTSEGSFVYPSEGIDPIVSDLTIIKLISYIDQKPVVNLDSTAEAFILAVANS